MPPKNDAIKRAKQIQKKHLPRQVVVLGVVIVPENKKLAKRLDDLIKEKSLDAEVKQNADVLKFLKHGVALAPAIIIDGKLKCAGKNPKNEDLEKWLNELQDDIIYQKELQTSTFHDPETDE